MQRTLRTLAAAALFGTAIFTSDGNDAQRSPTVRPRTPGPSASSTTRTLSAGAAKRGFSSDAMAVMRTIGPTTPSGYATA